MTMFTDNTSMIYDPIIHHRRPIRLKNFNYALPNDYFITICTQNMQHYFGKVENEKMVLNGAGQSIEKWWGSLKNKFFGIQLDEYVVMPNHFHGIVIVGADTQVCPYQIPLPRRGEPMCSPSFPVPPVVGADLCVRPPHRVGPIRPTIGQTRRSAPTIGQMIQWFKTMTTSAYIKNVKNLGWKSFEKKLWQRNYYERCIRDADELDRIREYIINNPLKWELEKGYPENMIP